MSVDEALAVADCQMGASPPERIEALAVLAGEVRAWHRRRDHLQQALAQLDLARGES